MTTAVERFTETGKQILMNENEFYGVYVSRQYNAFFETLSEAEAYCANPENDVEFNGQAMQSRYTRFAPVEVFCLEGDEGVYLAGDESRYLDPIGGKWQMPFVSWGECA